MCKGPTRCTVISASLQACGVAFPFAMLTSICRSIVTICSGLYLWMGMTRFSSKWILSHSTCTNFPGHVNSASGTSCASCSLTGDSLSGFPERRKMHDLPRIRSLTAKYRDITHRRPIPWVLSAMSFHEKAGQCQIRGKDHALIETCAFSTYLLGHGGRL